MLGVPFVLSEILSCFSFFLSAIEIERKYRDLYYPWTTSAFPFAYCSRWWTNTVHLGLVCSLTPRQRTAYMDSFYTIDQIVSARLSTVLRWGGVSPAGDDMMLVQTVQLDTPRGGKPSEKICCFAYGGIPNVRVELDRRRWFDAWY